VYRYAYNIVQCSYGMYDGVLVVQWYIFTVTWKPFNIGIAQRLLHPLDADWKELATYLLKDKIDERIKSIDASCSNSKVGNKALNEAVLSWRRRTTRDKCTWKTLCEVAGKWGDKTLEQYLNAHQLTCEQHN